MKIAIVGATGLVGGKMAEVLAEREFPVEMIIPVASEKSAGKKFLFRDREYKVVTPQQAVDQKPDIALFSAGAQTSKEWAPRFASVGCRVVDNSSYWRMDKDVKLIVPEVNGHTLTAADMIIANPNCSTIQMVVALNLLHKRFKLKRIVVSTYQSVTGSGIKGINQLESEREDAAMVSEKAYPYPIDLNVIPHIDVFLENGYTKEEMKMVNETHKIFGTNDIAVSATTVRVPVRGGHSESVNAEFEKDFNLGEIKEIIKSTPGAEYVDLTDSIPYPMPLYAFDKDSVYIGRLRADLFNPRAVNMWIVADNLRKGAATNAVQIAQSLIKFC